MAPLALAAPGHAAIPVLLLACCLVGATPAGLNESGRSAGRPTDRRSSAPFGVRPERVDERHEEGGGAAARPGTMVPPAALMRLPLAFEPNRGIADARVDYVSRGSGYMLALSQGAVTISVGRGQAARPLRLGFVGGRQPAAARAGDRLPGRTNYLLGRDRSRWMTDIPLYGSVSYDGVYDGIGLRYYGTERQLEFDFIVSPGADPSAIQLRFDGGRGLRVDAAGDLVIEMEDASHTISFRAPVAYQERDGVRQSVTSRYRVNADGTVGFHLGGYDSQRPLTIDPVLNWGTYLGGAATEEGHAIAVDSSGNVYVTGHTSSSGFPTSVGAYDTTYSSSWDVFVTKLNASDGSLSYSTFIGGTGGDRGTGIAVDGSGNAYVGGVAGASDFPTTASGFDTTFAGVSEGFFVKLNSTGTSLLYSTYIGGTLDDEVNALAIDSSGNGYVVGTTGSSSGIASTGAYDTSLGGTFDAFLVKFDPTQSGASSRVYGTYLGGTGGEWGYGVAVDSSAQAHVVGTSDGTMTFPANAYDSSGNGGNDVFVLKLDSTGTSALYGSYLGSTGDDQGLAIAVSSSGMIHITGDTASSSFPTTVGAYDTSFGGSTDVLVATFDPSLSGSTSLVYSTFLGGSGYDEGHGIAVNASGYAHVTGYASTAFPTTSGAPDTSLGGTYDGFVSVLNETGATLLFSTFVGGAATDVGYGMALSSTGQMHVTGYTGSNDFPTTAGSADQSANGGVDAFVAKFSAVAGITDTPTSGLVTTEATGTAEFTVVLNAAPTASVTMALSSSDTTEGTVSPSSLTFTTGNWSTPQTVTVTGVNDAFADGDIAYTIVTGAASSSDADYSGLNASDVSATNTDNEAVSVDAASSSSGNTASLTFSHTVGTGANRLLLVGVSLKGTRTVSSVTYGGVALQQVTTITSTGSAWLYKLLNPTSGTADVVVTLSGSDNVVTGAIGFTNVDQGAPLGPAVTASGTSTTPSVTVASRTGDVVLDVVQTLATGLTVDGSQDEQWNILQSTRGGGSTEAGASSVTMAWTSDTSKAWAQIGVSIRHASTTTGALVTGTYTGNATDNRGIVNQLGFEPDLVFIKNTGGGTATNVVFRTATMNGDLSKLAALGVALQADVIQSFDAPVPGAHWGGFTIGTATSVNSNLVSYEYVALTAKAGEVFIGSYMGDGVDSRSITGIGFQPDAVWVMSESTAFPAQKTSSMAGDTACDFSSQALTANIIQALQSDGFQVGTDAKVNTAGTTYHYVAFKAVASRIAVGTYTGSSGTDNRNITIASGFGTPALVVLKPAALTKYVVEKTAVSGLTTDSSCSFDFFNCTTDQIQQLITDGFQVGSTYNANGVVYYYTAFAQPAAVTAVRLVAFTAVREGTGAVQLAWRTGYESANRGFHLYREVSGVRTRVTASLVAGSGLGARTGDFRYGWRDAAAPADPVAYYLEDVDFDGTRVLHGPISPIPAGGVAGRDDVPNGLSEPPPLHGGSPGQRAFAPDEAIVPPRTSGAPVLAPTAALKQQWRLEAGPAIKLLVRARGWYHVSRNDLVAAGLPASVDPRRLQLFLRGEEQPLRVLTGAGGAFDVSGAIAFYGTGTDTPSTDTQVYWLVWGQQTGRRLPVVDGTQPGPPAAASFPLTVARRDRWIYFGALRNGDAESWFDSIVDTWNAAGVTLKIAHLDAVPPGPARLAVTLQGVTESPDGSANHRVGVLVNDTEVGEVVFAGRATGAATLDVAPALLRDGDNTITFVARGGDDDVTLVGEVQLTYAHTYAADGDVLLFTAEGGQQVTVTGFTRAAIQLVDVTDPAHAQVVRGLVTTQADGYALTAVVPGPGRRTLYAVTDTTRAAPAAIHANHRSTWAQRSHRADYLLITPAAFASEVAPLAAWRRGQGHAVAIVDVEDLYDAFSYGEQTPQALKDFLIRAHGTWRTPPRFVVLVGDATSDPRNYSGLGDADFVPTKLVDLIGVSLKTASDDWFADVTGDGVPTLAAIGRLSVRTPAQARAVVQKILAYEREPAGTWSSQALFVADANDADYDFELQAGSLAAVVPSGYTSTTIAKGRLGGDAARAALLAELHAGQRLVNYVGHGSTRVWGASADLLTAADAATLTNGARLPVMVAMSCLNGLFQAIWEPEASLAEALQRAPGGGAVAVWASSGATDGEAQMPANQALLRALLGGRATTLGEAIGAAKRATSDLDVRRTWILFGDPALVVAGAPGVGLAATAGPSGQVGPARASRAAAGGGAAPAAHEDPPVVFYTPEAGVWPAALRQGDGFRYAKGHWDPAWAVLPGDFNGDGFEDALLYRRATGAWLQATNRGDGTFAVAEGAWPPGWTAQVGRFTAGRDAVFLHDATTGAWMEAVSEASGSAVVQRGAAPAGSSPLVGDFDDDGLSDVFFYSADTGAWAMGLNRGKGDFTFTSGAWAPGWTVRVASLDGDGPADVWLVNAATGDWTAALTRGAGRFAYVSGTGPAAPTLSIADFDGDGRDDVLRYSPATGQWQLGLNRLWTTTPFAEVGGMWPAEETVAVADLDGDGRADVFRSDPVTGIWTRCLSGDAGAFACASGFWPQGWAVVGSAPVTEDPVEAQPPAAADLGGRPFSSGPGGGRVLFDVSESPGARDMAPPGHATSSHAGARGPATPAAPVIQRGAGGVIVVTAAPLAPESDQTTTATAGASIQAGAPVVTAYAGVQSPWGTLACAPAPSQPACAPGGRPSGEGTRTPAGRPATDEPAIADWTVEDVVPRRPLASDARMSLVVEAADAVREFGAPEPLLSGTLSGVLPEDEIRVSYATPARATSPPGTYPIVPTLHDPGGRLGAYQVTIRNGTLTIVDRTPPVVARATPSVAVLWPPDGRMVPVEVTVRVTDAADPAPACRILKVGRTEGTPDDARVTGALTAALRATRTPDGPGRTYTITVACADASGNTAATSISVGVPLEAPRAQRPPGPKLWRPR